MSELAGRGNAPGSSQDARMVALEAEARSLRAALSERDRQIDALTAARADAQIRLVADALPVLIAYVDSDERYLYNNRAYEDWTGEAPRRLLGRTLRDVLGAETYASVRPLVRQALAGERVSVERRLADSKGAVRHVHLDYVPDRHADGTVAGFYALILDITEAKSVETALRESEARFRAMADSAPAPIWVTGPAGVEFVNRAMLDFLGCEPEAILRSGWAEFVHPEDAGEIWNRRERAWAGEAVYVFDARFRRADGEWRWLHGDLKPRLDGQGKATGFVGIAMDMTETRHVETALRESEARFRTMADSAPAPVWVTNESGIEFVNKAFVDLVGLPPEALTGDSWTRLMDPEDLPQVLEKRARAWEVRGGYDYDGRFRRHDGELRWMHVSCKPRFDAAGRLIGYVGIANDITDAKRAEIELRASESLLRAMFDNAGVGMVLMDQGCVIARANIAFAGIVGRDLDALIGTCCLDITHPDDLAADRDAIAALDRDGHAFAFEKRCLQPDGRPVWVRVTLSSVGRQLLAIVEDVTARRRVEQALRQSEDRLRLATQAAAIGTWDFNPETGALRWDDKCKALFGLSPDAEVDFPLFLSRLHPDDREATEAAVARALDPNGSGSYEIEYRTIGQDDGVERWVAARGASVFEGGRPVRFIGTVIDITRRKRAEADLAQKEEALTAETRLLETLNRTGAAMASELDLERVVQMVTDAGVELIGAQFGAFFYNVLNAAGESYMLYTISGVDRSHFDKFPMPRNTQVFAPTFDGEGVVRSDDITLDPRYGHNAPRKGMPEGHLPVCSYLAVPVIGRSGDVTGGLFFGHAEPARFTERHEQLLVGIAGQAAVAIDNAQLFEAAQREIAERTRAQQALSELNLSLEARIAEAIEEQERVEEALRQAQKMEAVGQLTGGIAHDFNNLLTVISGNLDMAERRLGAGADAKVARAIASARIGAERAATLTQRLLAFSRRQPLAPKRIDANALLAGMSDLLHRTLGETIKVETRLAAGLASIEVDPNQLESAILNLAVNARDAMPDGGGLVIETGSERIGVDEAASTPGLAAGAYVAIAVVDTGTGMDDDTLRRSIEPFFTTKDVGKGTGLGLSMVYGFVKQSGGHLRIQSRLGSGTRIEILLPRSDGEGVDLEERAKAAAPSGCCDETILVCEDDEDVRAYTIETLAELGYTVIAAPDGPSTLRLLEDESSRIDLLFTDVVLPGGMSGATLAERAGTLRPGLKILFTTGYARDAIVHEGRLDPGVELITKPFAFADLANRLRDVLDR